MNFIQMLFYAVPLLSLAVAIMYAVFKIKEMKNESNNSNQHDDKIGFGKEWIQEFCGLRRKKEKSAFPELKPKNVNS